MITELNLDIALVSSIVLATIGGVWRAFVYYDRRRSTLDKDNFELLYRYFNDLPFYCNLQSTPLLRALFFRRIPLFTHFSPQDIAVIIKSQYELHHYNDILPQLPTLLHKGLIYASADKKRFLLSAKADGFFYRRAGKGVLLVWAVCWGLLLLAVLTYVSLKNPQQQGALTILLLVATSIAEWRMLGHFQVAQYLQHFRQRFV